MKFRFTEEDKQTLRTALGAAARVLRVNRKGRRHLSRLGGRLLPNAKYSEFGRKDVALIDHMVNVQLQTLEWALSNPEIEDQDKKENAIAAYERLLKAHKALGVKDDEV